jgi:hypothetical protein
MRGLVRFESGVRVIDVKDFKIMVVPVQLVKSSHVDGVFQRHYSQVPDLNGIGDSHFIANWNRGQVVGILEELEAGSASKSLSLQLHNKRLTVLDLEEHVQVMLHEVLHVILWPSLLDQLVDVASHIKLIADV